jgi:hypothetical protein
VDYVMVFASALVCVDSFRYINLLLAKAETKKAFRK